MRVALIAILAVVLSVVALLHPAAAPPTPQSEMTLRATQTAGQPSVIMQVLDPSLEQFAAMWKAEIGRRFPSAVGILVHGGDFVEGQWILGVGPTAGPLGRHVTPAADVVRHYQAIYPNRVIVLLACNTGHLRLGIPGVYYAGSSVWCVPDRALTPEMFASATETLRAADDDGEDQAPPRQGGRPSRWDVDPDVVGNIFEFVSD